MYIATYMVFSTHQHPVMPTQFDEDALFFHCITSIHCPKSCVHRCVCQSHGFQFNSIGLPFFYILFLFLFFCLCFSRQGFSVSLEAVLELALLESMGLKLTEIHLPLPPECWVETRAPPSPSKISFILINIFCN